ncbi:MAG: carboxylesterase family protein [Gammaproteobacteria bacterium]
MNVADEIAPRRPRRAVRALRSLLLPAVCALFLPAFADAGDSLRIATSQGTVQGKLSTDGRVRVFLGIPFAAPPVGKLRWKPPQPAANWRGVRQATAFGSRCMQPSIYKDMVFRDPGISEDCLTLNVWAPASAAAAKLPVMVWIYGGGFIAGGTSEPRQDGEHLARKGVVVVSMNYRLGIFGFLAHPELTAESRQHAAGNYGLLDQTAALRWVARNIADFGGDPANLTIFGESAGSMSVSAQMASPLARGLFVHAIGESGSAVGGPVRTLEDAETHGMGFARNTLGIVRLSRLRAVKAGELLEASTKACEAADCGVSSPDVDGYFLPEPVAQIYAAGKQAQVPLLAGWNRDEGSWQIASSPEKPTLESFRAMAAQRFGARTEAFLKVYAASSDEQALRAAEDFAGDSFIAYSTWDWLEAHVDSGSSPAYRYSFDLASPGDPNHPAYLGAFHSDEIEYVFGNLDSRSGAAWRPEDYALSDLMQTYWINFATNGNPDHVGVPHWPAYDAARNWQVMHLKPESAVESDAHRDRYLFLQQGLGNQEKR